MAKNRPRTPKTTNLKDENERRKLVIALIVDLVGYESETRDIVQTRVSTINIKIILHARNKQAAGVDRLRSLRDRRSGGDVGGRRWRRSGGVRLLKVSGRYSMINNLRQHSLISP